MTWKAPTTSFGGETLADAVTGYVIERNGERLQLWKLMQRLMTTPVLMQTATTHTLLRRKQGRQWRQGPRNGICRQRHAGTGI